MIDEVGGFGGLRPYARPLTLLYLIVGLGQGLTYLLVLGGGLVPASVVLVSGDPGIGKSTLLLMAAAGELDDLGRIVLPAELRKSFDIREGDHIEIAVDDDRIILSKRRSSCTFCGEREGLRTFRDHPVCASCHALSGLVDILTAASDESAAMEEIRGLAGRLPLILNHKV